MFFSYLNYEYVLRNFAIIAITLITIFALLLLEFTSINKTENIQRARKLLYPVIITCSLYFILFLMNHLT